ncbi:elongation factor 1-alpha-like [Jatropha curcas]|uniref:elongation factor 1-alpha-like n=1 Tax=Jatropha curcas TaxID=180498 RepID=UPI001895DE24|nr:elongation factor 1-alpha-like [Jatropha curcas]
MTDLRVTLLTGPDWCCADMDGHTPPQELTKARYDEYVKGVFHLKERIGYIPWTRFPFVAIQLVLSGDNMIERSTPRMDDPAKEAANSPLRSIIMNPPGQIGKRYAPVRLTATASHIAVKLLRIPKTKIDSDLTFSEYPPLGRFAVRDHAPDQFAVGVIKSV